MDRFVQRDSLSAWKIKSAPTTVSAKGLSKFSTKRKPEVMEAKNVTPTIDHNQKRRPLSGMQSQQIQIVSTNTNKTTTSLKRKLFNDNYCSKKTKNANLEGAKDENHSYNSIDCAISNVSSPMPYRGYENDSNNNCIENRNVAKGSENLQDSVTWKPLRRSLANINIDKGEV